MAAVYKYCDSHGVEILRNTELKITPPSQFNDPFEFTPRVTCSNLPRKAKALLRNKDNVRGLYLSKKATGQFTGSFREFRDSLRKARPQLRDLTELAFRMAMAKAQMEYLDHISTRFGILSMSKRRDSILMWGHYCKSHRGLVIGFDGEWEVFRLGKGLRPVQYVRERVQFDTSWKPGTAPCSQFTDQLILSKGLDWAYEQELRQMFGLERLVKKLIRNGTPSFFCPFPSSIVLSVTLGARCSPEAEHGIRSVLQEKRYSHVRLDRAVLHESDFALDFERVEIANP